MHKIALLSFFITFVFGQSGLILPGQKSAIQSLSSSSGFSDQELNEYLNQKYGKDLTQLSRDEGAQLIRGFQEGNILKSSRVKQNLDLAVALEIGMKKRFHFYDGTIREGEILSNEGEIVRLKTGSGTFNIPKDQFLAETAVITNKNGELFKGSVLGETAEEFIIRTAYGDAVVQKKNIQRMKRYHGGVLDRASEEKTVFYQGESALIGVFLDPTAFPLAGNTFYLSGLSIGYGLTDKFMVTSKIGSDFNNDLNLHPRLRFYHKKSAEKEVAAAWGIGLHRGYPTESIVSKYSHAINVDSSGIAIPLNEFLTNNGPVEGDGITVKDVIKNGDNRVFYFEGYLVFSSRRVNPTGRGKIGWSTGLKFSNAFMDKDKFIKDSLEIGDDKHFIEWSANKKYTIPFRAWASLEYDLRKDLKFLGSAWVDNGYRSMPFGTAWNDYTGEDGTAPLSLESAAGTVSMIDFDFGLQYTVNENFRVGLHFQQPFIDFYWEFLEF